MSGVASAFDKIINNYNAKANAYKNRLIAEYDALNPETYDFSKKGSVLGGVVSAVTDTAEKAALQAENALIREHLTKNRSGLGQYASEMLKQYDEYDADVDMLTEGIKKQRDILQRFDSKEQYDEALAYSQDFYNSWGHYYDAADFDQHSEYELQPKKDVGFSLDPNPSYWDDPLREAINGNQEAATYLWYEAYRAGEGTPEGPDPFSGHANAQNEGRGELKEMTEDEVALFNYLYATEGKERAHEYYNSIRGDLRARSMVTYLEDLDKYARDHQFGASVATILASPLKGISYAQMASDYLSGNGIDINKGSMIYSRGSSAVRSAVANEIEKGGWGKFGSWGYQLGMSMGDSLMAIGAGGGNQAFTLAIMGSGAAADTTIAAKQRGLSDGQAFALGTIAGAAEAFTEKIGLDALFDAKLAGAAPLKYLLRNSLSEGAEELTSGVINTFADAFIAADKSELQELVNKYKAQDFSDGGAVGMALGEIALGLGLDTIGGMVSGLGFGGTGLVSQSFSNASTGRKVLSDGTLGDLRDLSGSVQYGDKLDSWRAKRLSEAVTGETKTGSGFFGKIGAGISNFVNESRVGGLYNAVTEAVADMNRADIKTALESAGLKGAKLEKGVSVLSKVSSGDELTTGDYRFLAENESAMSVFSDKLLNQYSAINERNRKLQDIMPDSVESGAASEQIESMEFSGDDGTHNVASISEGAVVDETGTEHSPESIQYSDRQAGAVARSLSSLGETHKSVPEIANMPSKARTMIASLYSAGLKQNGAGFVSGALQAYTLGYNGTPLSALPQDSDARTVLTESQLNAIYNLGASQNSNKSTKGTKDGKFQNITFDGFEYSEDTATAVQKKSMKAIEMISKMSSLDIHVYKSIRRNGKLYAVINGKQVLAPNGYFTNGNQIFIDINAGNRGEGLMLYTVSHEIGHYIAQWNSKDFAAIRDFLFEKYSGEKTIGQLIEEQKQKLIESHKNSGEALPGKEALDKLAEEELVCDMLSRMFADKNAYDILMDLKRKDGNLFHRFGMAIRRLLVKVGLYDQGPDFKYAASAESIGEEAFRQLQELYIKAFVQADANFQAAEKNTTGDGVKEQARPSIKHPDQLDPRTVTREDVVTLLQMVERGEIYGDTYFPVRINTPAKLIYWAFEKRGDVIDNNPIAMSAEKAYNAMTRQGENEKGRPNRLTVPELVSMIDSMKDPRYIVHQGVNDRYVEVVEFDTESGDTAFAVIEIGNDKDAPYMNGFEGGLYNILVTTYPPKSSQKLRELLTTKGNTVIYNKMKDASQRTSSSTVPSVLNDASFYDDIIPDDGNVVKNESLDNADIEVDTKTESVAPAVLKSERTWTESDYVQEREIAAKEIAAAIGVSVKKAKAYIDSVNSIAKMIAEDRVRLDYFSSPGRTSFVGNVEYGGSFDFSTLCKKRRLLTGTFTAIQKALPNTALTADEILDIRNRMKEAGLEVSCGLCYVEGSRANMGQFAKEFLRLYKNDPRIIEAANAQMAGDPSKRVEIAEDIVADGFDKQDVIKAINSKVSELEPDSPSTEKVYGYYDGEDFAREAASGDKVSTAAAKEDIIQTQIANGKTKEEAEAYFASTARTGFKKLFEAGEITGDQAEKLLSQYCDMEEDDAYWKVEEWEGKMEDSEWKKYDDFYTAVNTGKDLRKTIQGYLGKGVSKKTLSSQITSHFKPIFVSSSTAERARLKGYLLNAYEALGYDRAQKAKDIDNWLKD